MATILSTGPVGDIVREILADHGELVFVPNPELSTLIEMVADAIALIVRGDVSIPREVIQAGKRLSVIGRTGVGYDNVDIAAASERKIPVINTPGANSRAVAEAALAMIMALVKQIPYWDQQMKRGAWASRFATPNSDLDGATLGILGLGSIGQMLAHFAAPFNMTLLAHDPHVDSRIAARLGVQLVSLDDLFQQSNVISIHAALTADTRGLISGARLATMRPGSYLVNLARGGLVESLDVILAALKNGTLSGAGLDVFEPEPPDTSHPLFQHPRCLTAPHALALTPGAMNRIYETMASDMAAVLSGGEAKNVVNRRQLMA